MTLVAYALFALLCFAVFVFGDAHRGTLGHFYGNVLMGIEAAIGVTIFLAWRLFGANRRKAALLVGGYGAATVLGALSWFVHPNQIVDRAGLRLNDWEHAIVQYQLRATNGEEDKEAEMRVPAMQGELRARQLEYEAARERFNGSASFYHGPHYAYILSAIALIVFASTVLFHRGTWPFGSAN